MAFTAVPKMGFDIASRIWEDRNRGVIMECIAIKSQPSGSSSRGGLAPSRLPALHEMESWWKFGRHAGFWAHQPFCPFPKGFRDNQWQDPRQG